MGIVAFDRKSVRGIVGTSGPKVGSSGPDEPDLRNCSQPAGESWHSELRRAVRNPAQLIAALELPAALIEPARAAANAFPLFAPWPYIARMAKGDIADPLLRQVLPLADECEERPGFAADPVGDIQAELSPGVLQKYHG